VYLHFIYSDRILDLLWYYYVLLDKLRLNVFYCYIALPCASCCMQTGVMVACTWNIVTYFLLMEILPCTL
jgi:hypothetical protein